MWSLVTAVFKAEQQADFRLKLHQRSWKYIQQLIKCLTLHQIGELMIALGVSPVASIS